MSDEELLAEAREFLRSDNAQYYDSSLIGALADALEAATRERDAALELMNQHKCNEAAEAAYLQVEKLRARVVELERRDGQQWPELVKAETERDAAVAAIERVREIHRKFTYYELEDSCPDTSEDHREERHHESDEIGEFYCEDMPTGDVVCDLCRDADGERMYWPCPTVAALDGAPEPEPHNDRRRTVKNSDVITPPISRERHLRFKRDTEHHLRRALELTESERDDLAVENDSYRRMVFALLTAMGGRVTITKQTLTAVPLAGVICSESDARDGSVRVWVKGETS